MESQSPAEQALQLLFKKLHPHLEDAAHALGKGGPVSELESRHRRLVKACDQASEILDQLAGACQGELAETLETLSANLTPVGANYQQQLILVQLCLEEAPAELLPFTAEGSAAGSSWGRRMADFLGRLRDPGFQARQRWSRVDPEIGDEARDDWEDA